VIVFQCCCANVAPVPGASPRGVLGSTPTFARGCSWDWYKSGEFLLGRGRGSVMFRACLASRFRTLISMTMLHVTMLQVTIILNYTFSSYLQYHKYLGFREFAKYDEWGKFVASVGHPKAKMFSASRGDAIAPLNRALTLRMSREPIQTTVRTIPL